MKFLLDTQMLLWASGKVASLPIAAHKLITDDSNELFFSIASLWEVAIKFSRGKADFTIDPQTLHAGLLRSRYIEVPIRSEHVMYVAGMPLIHGDPFDRLLVAQALSEGITLLTTDKVLAQYSNAFVRVL